MPLSRRELLAAGAASLAAGVSTERTAAAAPQASGSVPRAGKAPHPPNVTIRDYLVREARRITDHAINDLKNPAEVTRRLGERRQQFLRALGLGDLRTAAERGPVPHKITGVVQRKGFRIEKLHYESLPNLHVTANLYVPTAATDRRPPARRPLRVRSRAETEGALPGASAAVRGAGLPDVDRRNRAARRGDWLSPRLLSRGLVPLVQPRLLAGRDRGAQRHPRPRPARVAARGGRDPARRDRHLRRRRADAGTSRRRTSASRRCSPVCGTATLASHIYDRVIDGHCDCMWWPNTPMWDLADVGCADRAASAPDRVGEPGRHLPDRLDPRSARAAASGSIERSTCRSICASSKRRAATRITSDRAPRSSRGSSNT